MTTPEEFLQFAREMGLDQIPSAPVLPNENTCALTGLTVLNNLCHLIEQIHTLKTENNRLRAHLDLVHHVEKFLSKNVIHESIDEEEKHDAISPSNSLKMNKHTAPMLSTSTRDRQDCKGVDFINHHHQEDLPSVPTDHSETLDNQSGLPSWNKMRHALKFSLRRKHSPPSSPVLTHTERPIPAISISLESGDGDHCQDHKHEKKKKKPVPQNNPRRDFLGDYSDLDDEAVEFDCVSDKRKFSRSNTDNCLSHEASTTNLPMTLTAVDDHGLLTRKPSKIAHYRRKLRSTLNTVKKQFSDQHLSTSSRFLSGSHSSIFLDIGSGLNHALLTAKLAPAMTKSYQEKMRVWHSMQKSQFLVNYRRQSVVTKVDSRKTSLISTINEASHESNSSLNNKNNPENAIENSILSPILSPNQRSLIVHQWRDIMSEEIFLRQYKDYFQDKMQKLHQLEIDLKTLKTDIFCANDPEKLIKHQSMTNIDQPKASYLPQRSRSLQSLDFLPASWILAVQSAAYSDILDGTSQKTTERAILYNNNFFNQLENFKNHRRHFEQDTITNFDTLKSSKINISYDTQPMRTRPKTLLTHGSIRKLSLVTAAELPQTIQPLQSKSERTPLINPLPSPTASEPDAIFRSSLSSTTFNKRSKRSRFDLKKTLQRSKSMCMTQFNSWLQRRRQQQQQYPFVPRRKSAMDSKTSVSSPCSTPKLLGSPRLARFHQRLFKPHTPPERPSLPLPVQIESSSLDDSDHQFLKQESPVRIYLPARTSPSTRHVRITEYTSLTENQTKTPPMSRISSPILNRRNLSTTTRQRRESYAALSNVLNHK